MITAGLFEMSKAGSEMERITCLKGRTGTTPAPRSLQEGVCVYVTFCGVHAERSGCKQLCTWSGNAGIAGMWVHF